jgi:hypothetical protein
MRSNCSVTFIVPCLNGAYVLERCLKSIMAQTVLTPKDKIILVDNGSTDGSVEIAASLGVEILSCSEKGAANARNAGAAAASTKWLAFIDCDVELAIDWLEKIQQSLDAGPFVAALGSVEPVGPGGILHDYRRNHKVQFSDGDFMSLRTRSGVGPEMNSAAFVVNRKVFALLRGFDPSYRRVEDTEFSIRLFCHGGCLTASPAHATVHYTGRLWSYLCRAMFVGFYEAKLTQQRGGDPLRLIGTDRLLRAAPVKLLLLDLLISGCKNIGRLRYCLKKTPQVPRPVAPLVEDLLTKANRWETTTGRGILRPHLRAIAVGTVLHIFDMDAKGWVGEIILGPKHALEQHNDFFHEVVA